MSQEKTTPSKPSSTKQTTSWGLDKIPLTAADICDIIKICGTSGVSSFKLGDLQVAFEIGQLNVALVPKTASPPVSADPPESDSREVLEARSTEREQVSLDQLALENPAAYERALIQKAEAEDGIPTIIT